MWISKRGVISHSPFGTLLSNHVFNKQAMPQLTDRSKLPNIVDPVIRNSMDLKHLFQVRSIYLVKSLLIPSSFWMRFVSVFTKKNPSWSFLAIINCELNFVTWNTGCCCRGAMCTTRTELPTVDNRCSAFLNSSCTYWAWGITKRMIILCNPLVYIPLRFLPHSKDLFLRNQMREIRLSSFLSTFFFFFFKFTDQSNWNVIVPEHSRAIFLILGFLLDLYFISSYTSQSHALSIHQPTAYINCFFFLDQTYINCSCPNILY